MMGDNSGGKRRSKMGKVKAFEEMLMKDVPGTVLYIAKKKLIKL